MKHTVTTCPDCTPCPLCAKEQKWVEALGSPSIADAVKFRRHQFAINQRSASQQTGIPLKRWRLIEKGEVTPSFLEARRLVTFGIPADVILKPIEDEVVYTGDE